MENDAHGNSHRWDNYQINRKQLFLSLSKLNPNNYMNHVLCFSLCEIKSHYHFFLLVIKLRKFGRLFLLGSIGIYRQISILLFLILIAMHPHLQTLHLITFGANKCWPLDGSKLNMSP